MHLGFLFSLLLIGHGLREHVLRRELVLRVHLHVLDVGDETRLVRKHRLAHRTRPHLQVRPERSAADADAPSNATHTADAAHPGQTTGHHRSAGCPRVRQQMLPQTALVDVVLAAHRTRMVRDPALHSHFFVRVLDVFVEGIHTEEDLAADVARDAVRVAD